MVSFGELTIVETAAKGAESAENYAEQALDLAEELKLKEGRAEAILLLARIESAKGKGQKSECNFK